MANPLAVFALVTVVVAATATAGLWFVPFVAGGPLACCRCGGRDADTVAAIAGGLVGAAFGASAVPGEWRSAVHGWPGYNAADLLRLGCEILACR